MGAAATIRHKSPGSVSRAGSSHAPITDNDGSKNESTIQIPVMTLQVQSNTTCNYIESSFKINLKTIEVWHFVDLTNFFQDCHLQCQRIDLP